MPSNVKPITVGLKSYQPYCLAYVQQFSKISTLNAELVYGSSLRLPYHFFEKVKPNIKSDPFTFVERLKETMNKLKPVQSSNHNKQSIFVHKDMNTCTHVFIRHDGVRKSLQPTYDGPFEVISKHPKYFMVKVKGKTKSITIDRLKPMFAVVDSNIQTQPVPSTGKKVRFNV